MKTWNATAAKQKFSDLIEDSQNEPQVVELRGKPVSVVLSFDKFSKFGRLSEERDLKAWFDELDKINEYDIEEIVRNDRLQPDWE